MEDVRLLTKQEVATVLRLSIYTIDAWVSKRRNLRYVKIGRLVMFYESDVLDYLSRQTVSPTAVGGTK